MFLDALIDAAFRLASDPGILLAWLIVTPIALFSGAMPGGGLPFLAVLLGFAGYIDPWILITTAIFYSALNDITEPVPAILLGIPGSRSSQATVLDGYPMAQKGLAGIALGASYTCTVVGGVIGALALLILLAVGRHLWLLFGLAEMFLLALSAVLAVAVISSGAVVKGMLTASLAFAVAIIGWSPLSGEVRATFGLDYLWEGVPLVPIVIGLFAIPEAIALVMAGRSIAGDRVDSLIKGAEKDVYRGMREALNHKWLLVRASLIGVYVGALPGLGSSAAHWIAYMQARLTEKGGMETMGKGDVRGVIAADAANNSSDGGQLVPTLAFGIPGSASMVLILAMLVLSGITPGREMLEAHLDLTVSLVYVLIIGNIIGVPIMLAMAPRIARLTLIPGDIVAPLVICVSTLAAYMGSTDFADLVITAIFTAIGLFMKRYGWPRPPMLIALALSDIVEKYMWLSINTLGWAMFARPQFLIILVIMLGMIIYGAALQRKSMLDSPLAEKENPRTGDTATNVQRTFTMERVGEIVLLAITGAFFGYIFFESLNWTTADAFMPWVILGIGVPFWLIHTVTVLRQTPSSRSEQVMDTGFLPTEDPEEELHGFIRILLFVSLLFVGSWLLGFHVAIPLSLFIYLTKWSHLGWTRSLLVSLIFLGFIVVVFDWLLHVHWEDPVIMGILFREGI